MKQIFFSLFLLCCFSGCLRDVSSTSQNSPSSHPDSGSNSNPSSDSNNESSNTNSVLSVSGLADHLVIDGSVHTGTDWNGAPYIGVWGETFDFKMSDYPITWAIALVHASLLLQSSDVNYSPNAVLSVAIKESRLECQEPGFPNDDGCFQIEDGTAYTELQRLFSERFTASHDDIISDGHFETSALSLVYYTLFSMSMFYLHSDDPYGFFEAHPDPQAQQKVISAAYNRGLWWTGLDNVFANCADQNVTDCFVENGNPNEIAIDHATAIADYTVGLDSAPSFDSSLTLDDLKNYWNSIKELYPDADESAVLDTLTTSFNDARGNNSTLSFNQDLSEVLEALMAVLPPVPTHEEVTEAVCGLGYLWESPPCP